VSPGAAVAEALGCTLTVPDAWFDIEVRPGRRDAAISALVRARVIDQPELWPHRAAITRLLREHARRAYDAGARYCAVLVEPTDDGPITAAVTLSVVDGPLDASSSDADRVTPLLERLRVKEAAGDEDTWSQPGVVQIEGVGRCARTAGIEDLVLPENAGWVRSVVLQTFVPVPGDRRILLVTCSSPVLPLANELLDLFDAITATLRLASPT
jgi:hypothetical protein